LSELEKTEDWNKIKRVQGIVDEAEAKRDAMDEHAESDVSGDELNTENVDTERALVAPEGQGIELQVLNKLEDDIIEALADHQLLKAKKYETDEQFDF